MAPPVVETTLIGATEATKVTALNPSLFQSGLFAKVIVGILVSLFVTVATVATVGVVVWRANYRAPGPVNDYFETWKNTPLEMAVLKNDKAEAGGAPGDEGDKNTLRIVSLSTPLHGIVEILASKKHVKYTPTALYAGMDTFQYVVSNGKKEATGNVTVKVKNHAPEPKDDQFGPIPKNSEVDLDVLVNDVDIDEGDVLRIVSCTSIFESDMGTPSVNPDGLSLHWKPKNQYVGTGSFQYTVTDGNDTASATVFITVTNSPPVAVADTFFIVLNTPSELDVLANDYDPNGDEIEILDAFGQDNGRVDFTKKMVTYTPNFNYQGAVMFDYKIWDKAINDDGSIFARQARVEVHIERPDPFANDDMVSVSKNSGAQNIMRDGIAGTIIPYTSFSVQISTAPQHGTAQVDIANSEWIQFEYLGEAHSYQANTSWIMYTPTHGFVGNDELKYRVTDTLGGASEGTISIRVVNDPPTPVDDTAEVSRNSKAGVIVDVLQNDSDPNSDDLYLNKGFSLLPSHGTAVYVGDKIRYIPTAGYFGEDSFQYSVSDDSVDSQSSTATVYVTIKNDPPVPQNDFATVPKNVAKEIPVLANDVDPNQDILTIIAVADEPISTVKGTKEIVQSNPPVIRYTPVAGQLYEERFQYTVSDGDSTMTRSAWVYVNVTNTPPVPVDDYATSHWKNSFDFDLIANDIDENGDALSITWFNLNTQGFTAAEQINSRVVRIHVDHSRRIFMTPPVASATSQQRAMLGAPTVITSDHLFYQITDGQAPGTRTGLLTIDVLNHLPVAVDDAVTIHVNRETMIPVSELLANDSDEDGDELAVSGYELFDYDPAKGNLDLTSDQKNFVFIWKLKGTTKFYYYLSDGCQHTGTVRAVVTVNVVNDAPVAVDDFYLAPTELTPAARFYQITINDYDPDAENPTARPKIDVASVSGTTALGGTVSVVPNGFFIIYTAPPAAIGNDTFTYRVTDGYDFSNTATVTIQLVPGSPPQAKEDYYTIHWKVPKASYNVTFNDVPGDYPELSVTKVTPGLYTQTLAVNSDNKQIDYKPNEVTSVIGHSDVIRYETTDGVFTVSSTASFLIIDTDPECVDDSAPYVHWRSPSSSVDVITNDRDADFDPIHVISTRNPIFGRGTASLEATNKRVISYTFTTIDFSVSQPEDAMRVITDIVPYINTDTKRSSPECKAIFTVYNHAPVAVADSFTGIVKNAENVELNVLVNDQDTDAADKSFLTVFSATPGTGVASIVSLNPLKVNLVKGFAGTANLKYTIHDGKLQSQEATVSIQVVNSPPVCTQLAFNVPKAYGHTQQVSIFDLVGLACTDADGDTIELLSVGTSAIGTVGTANNKATFVPTENRSGKSVISFSVTDQQDVTSSFFNVTVVNNAPVATAIVDSFDRSAFQYKDYPTQVTDANNDLITLTGIAPAAGSSGTQDGPNRVLFADRGKVELIDTTLRFTQYLSGQFSVVYSATDNDLDNPLTASATATVTVNGYPPVAKDDSYVLVQGASADYYVMTNDTDPDGDEIYMDESDWLVARSVGGPTPVLMRDGNNKQFVRFDATSFPEYCKTSWFTYKIKSIDGVSTATATIKFSHCVCKVPLDIVYDIDGSGSITKGVFDNRVRPFLTNVTNQLDIGSGSSQIRVGIVQFGGSAVKETASLLTVKDRENPKGVLQVISSMSYLAGYTNTYSGLVASKDLLDNGRRSVNKLIIVLTDGEYNRGKNPKAKAKEIYDTPGWRIIAIAVGDFDRTKIQELVKNPSQDFFEVNDFEALSTVLQSVVTAACDTV